jgi:hypothetical protein
VSSGLPWTAQEDDVLIAGITAGDSDKVIAKRLDRSIYAITARSHWLRVQCRLPPAPTGRRRKPIDFSQEVLALGRKVPNGMRVLFCGGPASTEIELTHPDGDVSHHSIGHQA